MATIEEIDECFQQCQDMFPTIEEIAQFEESLIELNHITFGKGSIDIVLENARSFAEHNISGLERRDEELAVHKAKIEHLKIELATLEMQNEKKLMEKEILENRLKEFSTDRDIILAFKLGTLSHLSYNNKIKFGFLMKNNNKDYRTFAFNIDENSPEQVEDRWTSLKSFVSSEDG